MKKTMKKLMKAMLVVLAVLGITAVALNSTETGRTMFDAVIMYVANPDVDFDDATQSCTLVVEETKDYTVNNLAVNGIRMYTKEGINTHAYKAMKYDDYAWELEDGTGNKCTQVIIRNIDNCVYVYNRSNTNWDLLYLDFDEDGWFIMHYPSESEYNLVMTRADW